MTAAHLQGMLALGLAVAIHVAAFALRPEPAGAVSAGAGGGDMISLQAADAALAALVEDWERPPQVAEVTAPAPVLAEAPPPEVPVIDPPTPAPEMQALALPLPAEAPPTADVTPSAPPPPKTKPEAKKTEAKRPEEKARKTKPQKKPADSQATARAAGTGGGAQAGEGGNAGTATPAPGKAASLKAGWGAEIRSRIERKKRYPSAARGARGKVTLRLVVTRTGGLAQVSVTTSSGNDALDQAALAAVQSAARTLPPAPKGLTDPSYGFTLGIQFSR